MTRKGNRTEVYQSPTAKRRSNHYDLVVNVLPSQALQVCVFRTTVIIWEDVDDGESFTKLFKNWSARDLIYRPFAMRHARFSID